MFRFVVSLFHDRELMDTFYMDWTTGRTLGARTYGHVEEAAQGPDQPLVLDTKTFFFKTKEAAVEFAEWAAAERPGITAAVGEFSDIRISERPKVIPKTVSDKGVLPV